MLALHAKPAWRSSFYLCGSLGTMLGLAFIVWLREPSRSESPASGPSPMAGVATVLRTPMALILFAVFVGANFVASIVLTWMLSFLNRKFG